MSTSTSRQTPVPASQAQDIQQKLADPLGEWRFFPTGLNLEAVRLFEGALRGYDQPTPHPAHEGSRVVVHPRGPIFVVLGGPYTDGIVALYVCDRPVLRRLHHWPADFCTHCGGRCAAGHGDTSWVEALNPGSPVDGGFSLMQRRPDWAELHAAPQDPEGSGPVTATAHTPTRTPTRTRKKEPSSSRVRSHGGVGVRPKASPSSGVSRKGSKGTRSRHVS